MKKNNLDSPLQIKENLENSVSIGISASSNSIKINNQSIIHHSFHLREYVNDNCYYQKEISLWKAVVLQALVDLKSFSKKKMAKINRIKATLWLNLQNKDFLRACSYADLDPLFVWEHAQKIKQNNPNI